MGDVRDILELERTNTPELTLDSIINTDKNKKKYPVQKSVRRPEGMHREVFALLYNDNKDAPPLLPTDTGNGYKQNKARLGMRRARAWQWIPFNNPARTDGAVFHHWRRVTDENNDYPFAKFNKQVTVPTYGESEFAAHLRGTAGWGKQETDHLFDLAKRFDLRFVIMADRWDRVAYGEKSVEDLKERYYEVCGILNKLKGSTPKVYVYDAEHERRRKEQLRRLFERTEEQVKEEETLLSELKRIEVRKKERERKTQDLQKLISQADQQGEAANAIAGARRQDRKVAKKRIQPTNRPNRIDTTVVESAGIKWPDMRGSGVTLRSHRMKLPASVGQKKIKAIDSLLIEQKVELLPMPTDDICNHFNELRSDMVLLCELRAALTTCEFELQALRHQYEALCPGMTLQIPAVFASSAEPDLNKSMSGQNQRGVVTSMPNTPNVFDMSIIDVVGSPNTTIAH